MSYRLPKIQNSATDNNLIIVSSDLLITGGTSASTISATTIYGESFMDTCYLTYSGTSGTTSGTKGCTLVSAGTWTVTQFNTTYFIDDENGDITVTIPDASVTNEGKRLIVVKPRIVKTGNHIIVKTVSNQAVAETSTFYLRNANDRAELISTRFSASGSTSYKYRITNGTRVIHESLEVSIGGTQLFSDIKSAIDFVNSNADGPRRIKVNPGTYTVSDTIEINCPYPMTIEGFGTEITNINATLSLSGKPMFDIVTKCDFSKIKFSGTTGYGLVDDECCLDCGVDGLYFEVNNVVIDGFYKGVEIEGDSEAWVFNSIIENCDMGIYCVGGSVGVSEMTMDSNNTAFYLSATTGSSFSIQNSILNVNSGQTGILYLDNVNKPLYHFATGNAFYGNGTYISGLTFTSITQSDIRYESNTGLSNYKPEGYIWISGNTTATTLTVQNTYYKPNVLTSNVIEFSKIKFSGDNVLQSFGYLSTTPIKGTFIVSGDISVGSNTTDLSMSLYKNGLTRLQDIDVRCVTSNIPYSFAFNGINNMGYGDTFDVRVSCTNAAGRAITLRTLMFSINS